MQDPTLITVLSYKKCIIPFPRKSVSSTSSLHCHTFHQRSLFVFVSTHLRFTLYLFQSTSAAAAFPWRRASQQVCGRWGSVRHRRQNSSAARTRTHLWAPSPRSLSPLRASAAPAPAAGRATATCATVTRFIEQSFTVSHHQFSTVSSVCSFQSHFGINQLIQSILD